MASSQATATTNESFLTADDSASEKDEEERACSAKGEKCGGNIAPRSCCGEYLYCHNVGWWAKNDCRYPSNLPSGIDCGYSGNCIWQDAIRIGTTFLLMSNTGFNRSNDWGRVTWAYPGDGDCRKGGEVKLKAAGHDLDDYNTPIDVMFHWKHILKDGNRVIESVGCPGLVMSVSDTCTNDSALFLWSSVGADDQSWSAIHTNDRWLFSINTRKWCDKNVASGGGNGDRLILENPQDSDNQKWQLILPQ